MTPYGDGERQSGVIAFESGEDYIRIRFKSGATYLYTVEATGEIEVRIMKMLALRGEGLTSYIGKYVKDAYADKVED